MKETTDSAEPQPGPATAVDAAPAPERPKRMTIPALEGLRGAVALIVVTGHTGQAVGLVGWTEAYPGDPFWGTILHRLAVAFPIFFVMTGYLLYRSFALATLTGGKRPDTKRYFWRRALRILPAYWALTVVALFLSGVVGTTAQIEWGSINGVWDVLRPVLMLHIYQPNVMPIGMEHTWSNAVDFAFYLIMPVLALLIGWYARKAGDIRGRLRRMVVPLVALVFVGLGFTMWTHLPHMMDDPMKLWPMQYLWPTSYIGWLAAGMILAAVSAAGEVEPGSTPRWFAWAGRHPLRLWLGALGIFVLACLSPFAENHKVDYPGMAAGIADYWLFLGFAVLIITPLTVPGMHSRFIDALLGNRVMRFFGKISYGLFLWHVVVYLLFLVPFFGAEPTNFWVVYAAELAVATVAAVISYYLLERPFHKLRPWLGRAPAQLSVEVKEPAEIAQPKTLVPAPGPRQGS